ncbi:MAG: ROK family protein [Anaeroplasma bactoclasticum]|nr:ROK family protein [Anaeroplasma bactoclasticum]
MRVLCFDIGGTNIKYGVIDQEQFLEKGLFDTDAHLGKTYLTNKLVDIAKQMKAKYQIEGVGISCAGSVDFEHAYIHTAPDALPEFSDWDFRTIFKEEVGLDCIADNDVNSFAKAECVSGAGKDYDHFIVITVGTGIGGAIVMNDEIWRGKNYNAGEVGRILIGNAKWESVASTSALIKEAKRAGLDVNNGIELFQLYDNHDPIAMAVVSRFYDLLGIGMANLVYAFNPEAIIIGGGISKRETFSSDVEKFMNSHLLSGFRYTAKVHTAKFRNDGGMMGAYFNFIEYKEKNK